MQFKYLSSIFLVIGCGASAFAQVARAPAPDAYAARNRVFVLTDIGGEPDDQMSAARLLLYANEIDIEGLAAVSPLGPKPNPEILHKLIAGYAAVLPNLVKNAQGWPEAQALDHVVTTGVTGAGLAALRDDRTSTAALALIKAADRPDERPLWISIWGGASTLAEALKLVQRTRTPAQVDAFISKLRVYSISDQDDAGPWIRKQFPKLQYIAQPSNNYDDFGSATWTGISGDTFYHNDENAADRSTITTKWLEANIRRGPYGALYPRPQFIMEGDTPAYLGLIQNGLASAMSPAWGGWGGRYVFRRAYGEARPLWTQGGYPNYGINSRDRVVGVGGQIAHSDQATIWRWRGAFQNDFAARIGWTQQPFAQSNHNPVVVVNGSQGSAPLMIDAHAGETITLDAAGSSDPDRKQTLRYRWFQYQEAGAGLGAPATVRITKEDQQRATLQIDAGCPPFFPGISAKMGCPAQAAHIILEVTDSGTPQLTAYHRIIIRVVPDPRVGSVESK